MTRHILSLALCAILLALSFARHANADDPANAATWYWRSIDALSRMSVEEQNTLFNFELKPGVAPPQEIRSILSKLGPAFDAFQRGSTQQHAEFHLDRTEGWEMLLPHLMPMRQLTRAMALDAQIRLTDGDSSGAANRLAALYRSGQHIGDDRVLISSLVGLAMFAHADSVTQYGLDIGAFNAGDAASLLQTMKELDSRDPFSFLEALIGEQEITIDWLPKKFEEEDFDENFATIFDGTVNMGELTPERFYEHEMPLYESFMNEVIEVFAMEDTEQARVGLKALTEQLLEGEFGMIARLLSPSFDRALEQRERGNEMIANRITSLTELAEGLVDPAENINAAYHYLQGIALLAMLPPAQLHALRTFEATQDATVSDHLADCLLTMQRAVEHFLAGSLLRRCDFSLSTGWRGRPFIPEHAPGMRDAFRLLLADAVHLLASEQTEAAADRMGIAYRMIAHLASDEQFISSLVAHQSFTETQGLVASAIKDETFNAQQVASLARAFARIGRADPFGYSTAGRSTREFILRHLRRHFGPDDDAGKENAAKMDEAVRTGSGELLLSLLALREEMTPIIMARHRAEAIAAGYMQAAPEPELPNDEDDAEERIEPPHPLTGILALEHVPALRVIAERVVMEHDMRESHAIEELAAIRLADLGKRLVESRHEYRTAAALFNPITETEP